MRKFVLSFLLSFLVIAWLCSIFEVKLIYGDDFRDVVIKKVAKVIDEVFYFDEGRNWKILGVKVKNEVKPYLIVQVNISSEEAKELENKEIKVFIGDREIKIGKR